MKIMLRLSLVALAITFTYRAFTTSDAAACSAFLGSAAVLVAVAWGRW